jgi:hypothetical protein
MYFYIPGAKTDRKREEDEWRGEETLRNHVPVTKLEQR